MALERGDLAGRAGRRDRAVALADEELALARRWGTPRAIGVALVAAGIARERDAGLGALREAVTVLAPSAAPLEHARALTELGGALRRAGRRSEAREHLRELATALDAQALEPEAQPK